MISNNKSINSIQLIKDISSKIGIYITTFVGGYEIIKSFLLIMGFKAPIIDNWYFIITIFFTGLFYVSLSSVLEFTKTEVTIKLKTHKEQRIIIKIDNYEENMEKLINEVKTKNQEAIFVIGINDGLNMSIAQRKGVHRSVLQKFYNDENQRNLLQSKVNKAFNRKNDSKYSFGDIGIVDHDEHSKILFIVNSKYEGDKGTSILGPQPTNLIKNVFNELEMQAVEVVQFPILSSVNVRCNENNRILYSVTIAEIVEEYFKQLLNNRNISYDLVLSIRKDDLKNNLINLNSIVKFINELKPMYHIK